MSFTDIMTIGSQILSFRLLDIGNTAVTVSTALTVAVLLVVTWWLSRILQAATERIIRGRGGDPRTAGAVSTLLHYTVLVVGFSVALQTAGIDLTALFAAGAIFAIAIGFAVQSVAQNFVAGVILLVERSIKPGDVLEVEGRVVKVEAMGIRSTVARSRDGEQLIIPNQILVTSTFKNYTLADAFYRMQVSVGVVYRSDMALVRETLEQVASQITQKWGVTAHSPIVVMAGFGDNAVEFRVAIWMPNPRKWLPAVNELHEAIWAAFREKDIVIAFPQLDVHFDPAVTAGFETMGKVAV